MDIVALSKQYGVTAERGKDGSFPVFLSRMQGKRVLVFGDLNTAPLAEPLVRAMEQNGSLVKRFFLPEREPVADEKRIALVKNEGADCDLLLAVGSGTLNDIGKYAGMLLNIPCGVYATAPSMDGFASGVAALTLQGKKVTYPARVVSHILIDDDVLAAAPGIMRGAGVGDILAKYCCLTDWRISSYLTGEEFDERAASLMYDAVRACDASIPDLIAGKSEGAARLMDALLVSGYAMVIAGNSRPASGAEHHMSHYLEMDFLRRGLPIPLHGVKVGLGTAVSLYLYHTLERRPAFKGCERVYAEAKKLPGPSDLLETLGALGCPTRFSELGVSEETVRGMFLDAYKIRDRFTILTLYCTYGFMTDGVLDELIERFY